MIDHELDKVSECLEEKKLDVEYCRQMVSLVVSICIDAFCANKNI